MFARLNFWTQRRHILTVMLFIGFLSVFALRVLPSVTIIAMTSERETESGEIIEPEFDWNSRQQGYVLSSFFYGYFLTQFPGGLLSRKYGGHIFFGAGIAGSAVMTLLIPLAAKTSLSALIVSRVLAGFFEGVSVPSVAAILSKWAPPLERTGIYGFLMAGTSLGFVIALVFSGMIIEYINWESVNYIFGSVCLLWYIAWLALIRSGDPEHDPFISETEKKYILDSIKAPDNPNPKIPWKNIFTSMAVLAIFSSNFTENWAFYTLLTQMPSYLENILNFDIANTGFLSALPYLVMGVFMVSSGYIADWLQVKGYLTRVQVRKILMCGAFFFQFIFLLITPFVQSPAACVTFLTFGMALGAFAVTSFGVNALDIAPQFASIIMGLQNTIGTIPGIVSPILTGFIVPHGTIDEWRIVFFISAGICLCGAIFYWIFAKAEIQSWAEVKVENESTNNSFEANESNSNKSSTL